MLAVLEKQALSFFKYTTRSDVREFLIDEYHSVFHFSEQGEDLVSISQLASHMSEYFIHELFLRQLNEGDVSMFASREDCIEAYDNEEKMEQIMSDAHEVISYSGMFGRSDDYTSDLEQGLIDDVILLLEESQLMYAVPIYKGDEISDGVFVGDYLYDCTVKNNVLQEVW